MPILPAVVGVLIACLNLVYWWLVVTRGTVRFRAWVEQRYHVTITNGYRGHWRVMGAKSKLHAFGIELLQFVFFMSAFFVWSIGMTLGFLLLQLVAP